MVDFGDSRWEWGLISRGSFPNEPLWVLVLTEYWNARLELVPAFRSPDFANVMMTLHCCRTIETGKGWAKPFGQGTCCGIDSFILCFGCGCQGASSDSVQRPSLMDCLRVMRESHFVDNRSVVLGEVFGFDWL